MNLDSMKCMEFLDQLKSCRFLKMDPVPYRASSKLRSPLLHLCLTLFSEISHFRWFVISREVGDSNAVLQRSSCITGVHCLLFCVCITGCNVCLLKKLKVLLQKQPHYTYPTTHYCVCFAWHLHQSLRALFQIKIVRIFLCLYCGCVLCFFFFS